MDPWLTTAEVVKELGISPSTLYAYVSRGLIRSRSVSGSNTKRYSPEDVETLKLRKARQAIPTEVVEDSLSLGLPVLASQITLVSNETYYYRGYEAVGFSLSASFEQTLGLLWTGRDDAIKGSSLHLSPVVQESLALVSGFPFIELAQAGLALAGSEDPVAYDFRTEALLPRAAAILSLLSFLAGARAPSPLAEALKNAWCPHDPYATKCINAALSLAADHELNPSTFTVRCVASSGSSLYSAVGAGLASLSGLRHGRSTERIEALLDELDAANDPLATLQSRMRRGESLAGFGHPLYKGGDPRATALLNLIKQGPYADKARTLLEFVELVNKYAGNHPNLDFGLVALRRAMGLPEGAALTLFALGRTGGWIAHALEEYQSGRLIRPRARYVGPQPVVKADE